MYFFFLVLLALLLSWAGHHSELSISVGVLSQQLLWDRKPLLILLGCESKQAWWVLTGSDRGRETQAEVLGTDTLGCSALPSHCPLVIQAGFSTLCPLPAAPKPLQWDSSVEREKLRSLTHSAVKSSLLQEGCVLTHAFQHSALRDLTGLEGRGQPIGEQNTLSTMRDSNWTPKMLLIQFITEKLSRPPGRRNSSSCSPTGIPPCWCYSRSIPTQSSVTNPPGLDGVTKPGAAWWAFLSNAPPCTAP